MRTSDYWAFVDRDATLGEVVPIMMTRNFERSVLTFIVPLLLSVSCSTSSEMTIYHFGGISADTIEREEREKSADKRKFCRAGKEGRGKALRYGASRRESVVGTLMACGRVVVCRDSKPPSGTNLNIEDRA